MRRLFLIIISVVFLYSCGGGNESKRVAVFEETVDSTDGDEFEDFEDCSEVIAVPFKEESGVKTVEVKINDVIGVNMIVDTGCSGILISLSEAKYLIDKGTLTKDDIIGTGRSQIADGSIVENDMVLLHKVTIGNKLIAKDVVATVSSNMNVPLLLGNEVFDRVQSVSIDNRNKQILFHLN